MIRRFARDCRAAAAAEMALVLPMLTVMLFGFLEIGHFLWSEHKVVEGVRAGARYASRLPITAVCPTSGTVASGVVTDIATLTRTGSITGTVPLVPGWASNNQVVVTFGCGSFVGTGIYTAYGANGPTVTVKSTGLTYPSLFGALGIITSSVAIGASSSTAVIGI